MPLSATERSRRHRKRHPAKVRTVGREAQRKHREKVREEKRVVLTYPEPPKEPGKAFCAWTKSTLKIPPGHQNARAALILPAFLEAFFVDSLAEGVTEASLIIARKNGKSAAVASYLLSRLVGCLRVEGYRAGVCSISREKAHELRAQCELIATASGLKGLRFWRRGVPAITSDFGGSVDVLSAEKTAGQAGSYDDSIVDEIVFLQEAKRDLVSSMRSSVSAKAGRFWSLSVHGDGPFVPEILERRGAPGLVVHLHQAAEGAKADDKREWVKANLPARSGAAFWGGLTPGGVRV